MTDLIELRGLRVVGVVGVLPEERTRAQPFEVDLTVAMDLRAAGRSDVLADTFDYSQPLDAAVSIIESESHLLLERVAQRIAEETTALDERIEWVEVVVRKLRPALPHDLASTAARIVRRRGDASNRPNRAFLALGSNLGDRRAHLRGAVESLGALVVRTSSVYETDPIGGPEDQGAFLNMVLEVAVDESPHELLDRCQALEMMAGRERVIEWGPRTLDVDILLYDERQVATDRLIVPHPRMWERRFVLEPLAEIAPDRVPPDWRARVGLGGVHRVDPL